MFGILLTTILQMQFCFTIVFPQTERGFMSCAVKPRYPPLVYEVLDKGTMKSEILHHLPVAKRGYDSKRWLGGSYSMRSPHKQKTTWQRPITSAFAWCCSRCLWARCLVTARAGRYKRTGFACRCPPCGCLQHNQFCLVFSKEFNIMSVLFVTNRPSRRKKSILARVCFTANRG